ncbi:MAG: hypothetical protein RL672_1377 [Actinomycetota bacterium]
MKNRVDIQWLRALAVGMVVLFHLWPTRVSGGFAGVDVFFVISGYLITAGLLRKRPRLGEFWLRRIRRLLPSALVVILATVLLGFVVVPPGARGDFGGDAIASTFYFENWWLVGSSSDYFAAVAPSPFQHFWSLAVEEQFYLVWPVLILALGLSTGGTSPGGKGSSTLAKYAFGVVAAASFAWSLWQTNAAPSEAYFSTFSRAWEFAVGALLASGHGSRVLQRLGQAGRRNAAVAGFALIALAAFGLNEHMAFPGWAALLPVVGTALVIWAAADFAAIAPRLAAITWVGDISYGLYLWHWPVIILGGYLVAERGSWLTALWLAISVALAWASKRWIEDPIRRSTAIVARRKRAQYFAAAASSLLVFSVAFALNGVTNAQLTQAQTAAEKAALEPCFGANAIGDAACLPVPTGQIVPSLDIAKHDAADPGSVCMTKAEASDVRLCDFGNSRAKFRVLLVGDSHAATLLPALKLVAQRNNWQGTLAYHAGCSFSLVERDSSARGRACADWNTALQNRLAKLPAFDLVITENYAKNRLADLAHVANSTLADGLAAAWQPLIDRGSRVVAVRDNPEMTTSMKRCWGSAVTNSMAARCSMHQAAAFVTDPIQQAQANTDSVKLLDITSRYCIDGTCPAAVGGVWVYRNADHISASYSRTLTLWLEKRLQDLLGGL